MRNITHKISSLSFSLPLSLSRSLTIQKIIARYLKLLVVDGVVGEHDKVLRGDVIEGLELGAQEEAGRPH